MLMVFMSWIADVDSVDSLGCWDRWQFKPITSPMHRYLGRYIDIAGLDNQYFQFSWLLMALILAILPSCRCRCRNLSHRWHYHQVMMILSWMHRWQIPGGSVTQGCVRDSPKYTCPAVFELAPRSCRRIPCCAQKHCLVFQDICQ